MCKSMTQPPQMQWTPRRDYPQHRFLPHQLIQSDDQASTSPIHVGFGQPVLQAGLLINLATEIPDFLVALTRCGNYCWG